MYRDRHGASIVLPVLTERRDPTLHLVRVADRTLGKARGCMPGIALSSQGCINVGLRPRCIAATVGGLVQPIPSACPRGDYIESPTFLTRPKSPPFRPNAIKLASDGDALRERLEAATRLARRKLRLQAAPTA